MKWFLAGFIIATGIELFTRITSNEAPKEDEYEPQPIQISDGSILKTVLGIGAVNWLVKKLK